MGTEGRLNEDARARARARVREGVKAQMEAARGNAGGSDARPRNDGSDADVGARPNAGANVELVGGVRAETEEAAANDATRGDDANALAPAINPPAPLLQDAIDALNTTERRKILGLWSARVRGVKRRLRELSRQYPTSSFVLLFTKPFNTEYRRVGMWYESHESLDFYATR